MLRVSGAGGATCADAVAAQAPAMSPADTWMRATAREPNMCAASTGWLRGPVFQELACARKKDGRLVRARVLEDHFEQRVEQLADDPARCESELAHQVVPV